VLAFLVVLLIGVPSVALVASNAAKDNQAGAAGQSASSATPSTAPLADTELVRRFGDSVYRVEVQGCDVAGSGTAFVVDEHHLVTAGHVVAFDPNPLLQTKAGAVLSGRVIGYSLDPDVAVIEVDDSLAPPLSWADPSELSEGEHLLGLGYPVPALDFSAQPGTIVSFHSDGAGRPAVRTDAALDHGDSGGPALTDRGQVVGVITELAQNDGVQIVPIVFTRDALGSSVDRMIAHPEVFTTDCAADWGPPSAPPYVYNPPTAPAASIPPLPTVPTMPTYTIPTTTTLPCPSGAPVVEVTSVTATHDSYAPEWWTVHVEGRVINNASATVDLGGVDVVVQGSSPSSTYGFMNGYGLRSGQTSTWSADDFMESSTQPTTATASLSYWSWSDYQFYDCGTG
jgi:hypothetical protein